MNKEEKVHKLVNAVKEWRGAKVRQNDTQFLHGREPKPSAEARVRKWLAEIHKIKHPCSFPEMVEESIKFIENCSDYPKFHQWLKEITE